MTKFDNIYIVFEIQSDGFCIHDIVNGDLVDATSVSKVKLNSLIARAQQTFDGDTTMDQACRLADQCRIPTDYHRSIR